MKNMRLLNFVPLFFLLIQTPYLYGQWVTENITFTDKWGGGPSEPLYEKNRAYLYCENSDNFIKAKQGSIDWIKADRNKYCEVKHNSEDDTWRSGWNRSRLRRACKSKLGLYDNPAYKCWDYKSDPAVLATESQLADNKNEAYLLWQPDYRSAHITRAELWLQLDKVGERYANDTDARWESLMTLLNNDYSTLMNEKEVRQTELNLRMAKHAEVNRSLATLEISISSAISSHESFTKEFNARLAEYDLLSEKLVTAMSNDKKDVDRILMWARQIDDVTHSKVTTSNNLNQLIEQIRRQQNSCTLKVCEQSRSSTLIKSMRSRLAFLDLYLKDHKKRIYNINIPELFKEARINFSENVEKIEDLNRYLDSRDSIFSDEISALLEQPKICQIYQDLIAQVMAKNSLLSKETEISALDQFTDKFIKQLNEFSETHRKKIKGLDASKELHKLAANFDRLIDLGKTSEAKLAYHNADTQFALITNNVKDDLSDEDMERIITLANKISIDLKNKADKRFSLNSAHRLIFMRLQFLQLSIADADDLVMDYPAFQELWRSSIIPDIYKKFNTVPFKEISRPVFKSFDELLVYDQLIAESEATIAEFNSNLGAR